jgi:tRNA-2-methylthio-N6-dimethylallyladenosine synthase
MKYHIWTEGCQMNVADSMRVASSLEYLGYKAAKNPEEANIIVLNTCVVRQSAEDKAVGRLFSLRPLKERNPNLVINLMGCLVGIKNHEKLKKRFPFVDVFSPPSDPSPLVHYLLERESHDLDISMQAIRNKIMDEDLLIPLEERGRLISTYVSVVLGCSHACTYCIIPYRRGPERSRSQEDIIHESKSLINQGVKEITLLGQIVDRYGKDLNNGTNLSELLRTLHKIPRLERIRFLTSHPNWMTNELLDTVAELPKVMPHIEVPIQAGDDIVLQKMKRGYTVDQYRQLIHSIRERISDVSISTDVIVGFPGETEKQFQHTYDLLTEMEFDVAHLARYSPRTGTVSARRMIDDVSETEKMDRFRALENLQKTISAKNNARLLDQTIPVLFEDKVKGRWQGRTPTNKLVFLESNLDLRGSTLDVNITWAGPWSMQATLNNKAYNKTQ